MKLFVIALLFSFSFAHADEKLPIATPITEIPSSAKTFLKESFSKKAIPAWGLVLASTALTYYYDEQIYGGAARLGQNLGIGNDDHTKTLISVGSFPIFRGPTDWGSAMYFFGDGWFHAGISVGFMGIGQLTKNNKAFNTGIMIAHGMAVSTIFNQILKRSFGRETPGVKTEPRGKFRPFPSFTEYGNHTPNYDAMPSGHVMTFTHTMVVLAEQYPESATYVYSIGGAMLAALSFQMINNGVHWASDYPLGIAMGYLMGKISSRIGKPETDAQATGWTFFPSRVDGVPVLNAALRFN